MAKFPRAALAGWLLGAIFFSGALQGHEQGSEANPFPHLGVYRTALFDFYRHYPSPCDEPGGCYRKSDMIALSLRLNYESKQAIEQLYQARIAVKKNLGSLLPHVTINNTYNTFLQFSPVMSALDLGSSFIGFLFPNRWFNWKASRILAAAEVESVKTLFADRAQIILSTYYYLQQQIWQMRIANHYIEEIEKLIAVLHYQRDHGMRQLDSADFAVLENIRGRQKYALSYIDSLSATYPRLAYSMGMAQGKDWTKFNVEPDYFVAVAHYPLREPREFYERAEERSTELTNVKELIKAARLNKRSNYFDIIDPSAGSDIGYSYAQRIKISRASVGILETQLDKTKAQIIVNINTMLNSYNDSIVALRALNESFISLDELRKAVEDHVNDLSSPFNITGIARYFEIVNITHLNYCSAYYLLMTSKAGLERLTWEGPYYQQIHDYARTDLGEAYQEVRKRHSFKESFKRFFKIGSKYRKEQKEPKD